MTVWFTSDLHFGHRFVSELRGFESIEDHDDAIVSNWRARVRRDDVVFVLGDIAVSSPEGALSLMHWLPGKKHLIAGNHDGCHPLHRDSYKWQLKYLKAFDSVQAFARRRINGQDVLLSHFPYSADRGEARYTQYRLADEGLWLLHGHTHSHEKWTSPREIHVGLDAWNLAPVSLEAIADMMGTP